MEIGLNELIESVACDGVLTDDKKQVLFDKADSLGIPRDEFEIVLTSRIEKNKKCSN